MIDEFDESGLTPEPDDGWRREFALWFDNVFCATHRKAARHDTDDYGDD